MHYGGIWKSSFVNDAKVAHRMPNDKHTEGWTLEGWPALLLDMSSFSPN